MSVPSPWIERLNLMPHPEGGFYKEVFRCDQKTLPGDHFDGERSLATCVVAPGFDFRDFEMAAREELKALCPQQGALIDRLTLR